jgi:hypothetical protein
MLFAIVFATFAWLPFGDGGWLAWTRLGVCLFLQAVGWRLVLLPHVQVRRLRRSHSLTCIASKSAILIAAPIYAILTATGFGILWWRGLPGWIDSMKPAAFVPGFRFGRRWIVLAGGGTGAIVLSMLPGARICAWLVIAHFFLFRNVVRWRDHLSFWGGVFVALAAATIAIDTPGWLVTTVVSLGVTVVAVIVQIRKPEYHGVGWKWINPGLPAWWEARIAKQGGG